jgi:hypothetical protein
MEFQYTHMCVCVCVKRNYVGTIYIISGIQLRQTEAEVQRFGDHPLRMERVTSGKNLPWLIT